MRMKKYVASIDIEAKAYFEVAAESEADAKDYVYDEIIPNRILNLDMGDLEYIDCGMVNIEEGEE